MRKRLETFIHHLEQIDTLEALNDAVVNLCDLYEVDHLVYHSVNSTGEQYAALTYDDKWVNHYMDEDLSRVDPVRLPKIFRFLNTHCGSISKPLGTNLGRPIPPMPLLRR